MDKSSTKQVGRDQIGFLNEQLMMYLPRLGQTTQSIGRYLCFCVLGGRIRESVCVREIECARE